MDFLERLKSLWPDNAKPADFYNKIDMSASGFSRVWKDGAIPTADYLIKIQEVTGCDLNWLLTGQGSPYMNKGQAVEVLRTHTDGTATDTLGNPINLDEFVFIPRYDVYAAAGHGYPAEDDKPLFCMAFRRYWIENYVTRQLDKLSVIAVKGDSMEGVLNHGDNILVNHAETTPRDGLYVIRIDNHLFVKQIQKLPGKLLVKSANPVYEPFEIDLTDDNQNVAIIGRVEWYGRTVHQKNGVWIFQTPFNSNKTKINPKPHQNRAKKVSKLYQFLPTLHLKVSKPLFPKFPFKFLFPLKFSPSFAFFLKVSK